MTELRRRMLEDMRIRNLSEITRKRYVDRVAAFARHSGMFPEHLGPKNIRAYQLHLVDEKWISTSYLNVTVCALRFLYGVTLKREWEVSRIPLARREKRLPVVLSTDEVGQFFRAIRSTKYRTVLMTALTHQASSMHFLTCTCIREKTSSGSRRYFPHA